MHAEVSEDPVTFMDHAVFFEPLTKRDPDTGLSAQERAIGRLGIFMTKKIMDEFQFEYPDGRNILSIRKELN